MLRGRPIEPVVLTDDEEFQLLSLANSRALPHGLVRPAQIVLACAKARRTPRSPGACTLEMPPSASGTT